MKSWNSVSSHRRSAGVLAATNVWLVRTLRMSCTAARNSRLSGSRRKCVGRLCSPLQIGQYSLTSNKLTSQLPQGCLRIHREDALIRVAVGVTRHASNRSSHGTITPAARAAYAISADEPSSQHSRVSIRRHSTKSVWYMSNWAASSILISPGCCEPAINRAESYSVRSERRSASRPTLRGQRRTTDRARGPRFDQHGPPRPWRTSAVTTDPQPGWRVCTGKWAARRRRRSNRFGRARRGSADRSRSGRNRLATP
jgi:hypothetical protein